MRGCFGGPPGLSAEYHYRSCVTTAKPSTDLERMQGCLGSYPDVSSVRRDFPVPQQVEPHPEVILSYRDAAFRV
jgi:hypothetical protein